MSKTVQHYRGRDGGWRWRVVSRNGQITATSGEGNGFVSLSNCKRSWRHHVVDIRAGRSEFSIEEVVLDNGRARAKR